MCVSVMEFSLFIFKICTVDHVNPSSCRSSIKCHKRYHAYFSYCENKKCVVVLMSGIDSEVSGRNQPFPPSLVTAFSLTEPGLNESGCSPNGSQFTHIYIVLAANASHAPAVSADLT